MKKTTLTIVAILCCGLVMGQQRMEDATYYGHLYLKSTINGHMARLAFDTGSPYLCLDSTYQADSGYSYKNVIQANMGGSGNNRENVRAVVDELTYTLAGQTHKTKIAPIFSLKPILGDYADGILGMSELDGKVIAIDYAKQKVGFWDSMEISDTKGYTLIPIRYEGTRIFVPIKVTVDDGKVIEGEGLMDLGSGNSVTLTSVVAEQYGLKNITPLIHFNSLHGGIGGESSSCDFRADHVTIGPFVLNGVTMDFSNNTGGSLSSKEYIGIVGNDIWERFDMIVDLSRQKLYLKPNGDFEKPFAAPVLGFSYTDRSQTLGYWVVNGLYRDSNAEKAGLQHGDHIIAVNGRSVKDIDMAEQRNYFDGMTTIRLTLQHDGGETEITFKTDEPKF